MSGLSAATRRKLELIFAGQAPLEPDERLKAIAGELAAPAKQVVNASRTGGENYVAIGCCCSSLAASLGRITSLPGSMVMFINMLAIDFAGDFLAFVREPGPGRFEYLFSKYMRHLELASGNATAALMYEEILSRRRREYSGGAHIHLAASSYAFVMLHEMAHTQPELIESFSELFHEKLISRYFAGQSKAELVESACDFMALISFSQLAGIEKMKPDLAAELYEAAIFQLLLPALYSFMPSLLIDEINRHGSGTKAFSDALMDAVAKRMGNLSIVALTARLNGNLPDSFDLAGLTEKVQRGISEYLSCMAQFLGSRLISEVEDFNLRHREEPNPVPPPRGPAWFVFC